MLYYKIIKENPKFIQVFFLKSIQQILYVILFINLLVLLFNYTSNYESDKLIYKIFNCIALSSIPKNNPIVPANCNITSLLLILLSVAVIIPIIQGSVINSIYKHISCSIQKNIPLQQPFEHCSFYYEKLLNDYLLKILIDITKILEIFVLNTVIVTMLAILYKDPLILSLFAGNLIIYNELQTPEQNINTLYNHNKKLHTIDNIVFPTLGLLIEHTGVFFVFLFFLRLKNKISLSSTGYVLMLEKILNNSNINLYDNSVINSINLKDFYTVKNIKFNGIVIKKNINYIQNRIFKCGIYCIEDNNSSNILQTICNTCDGFGVHINNKPIKTNTIYKNILYLSKKFSFFKYGSVMDNMLSIFPTNKTTIENICLECNINPNTIINPHYGFNKQLQEQYINLVAIIFLKTQVTKGVVIMDGIEPKLLYDKHLYIKDHIVLHNDKVCYNENSLCSSYFL